MSPLTARLRRVARSIRHTPDRLVHRLRQRRARRVLSGVPRVDRVLFVCYGNICRSPYAMVTFQRCAPGIHAISAGFVGPDRPSPANGIEAASRRGHDLTLHRSQLLTPELTGSADLIVVMEDKQRRALEDRFGRERGVILLGDLDPEPIDTRTVLDPYDREIEVFEAVYERIDRCVAELAAVLTAGRIDPAV